MTLAVAEALNPNEPNQFPVAGRRQSTILLTFVWPLSACDPSSRKVVTNGRRKVISSKHGPGGLD